MAENNLAKNKSGGKYKYTDIAQIHEYLEANNITYYQYIERIEGDDYIYTVPTIDGKELPPRRGCRVVDATLIGIKNPAQEQGSALTYARRYSLLMAFGLATEDDDAQSLSKKKDADEPKNERMEDAIRVGKPHIETIRNELKRIGMSEKYFCKLYKVNALEELSIHQFKDAMANFEVTPSKE